MLAPTDILIQGNTLCISERLLTDVCGLSAKYLCDKIRPLYRKKNTQEVENKQYTWKFTKINGQYYYDFDTIPNRKNNKVHAVLGPKEQLIAFYEQQHKEQQQAHCPGIIRAVNDHFKNTDVRYYQYDAPFTFNYEKATHGATFL